MTREDEIRREEARRRLEARLARNGTANSLRGREAPRASGARGDRQRSDRKPVEHVVRRRDYSYNAPVQRESLPARLFGAVSNLLDQFGWRPIVALIAAIVVFALLVSGIRGCAASREEASAQEQAQAQQQERQQEQQPGETEAQSVGAGGSDGAAEAQQGDVSTLDTATLTSILGEEYEKKLVARAAEDPDIFWVASHPEAFTEDGDMIQYKLLKLAAIEPAATLFVREFPDKYPLKENVPDDTAIDSTSGSANGVPRLFQWDQRWGYTEYSSTAFAFTGCCPTALSMVYQAKTGDTSMTPFQMGQAALEGGYMSDYDGTSSDFLTRGAEGLGLSCSELDISADSLRKALEYGDVVIINVGEGDFTEGGHYIVAVGVDSEGNVTVNDPFSLVNSDKTWPIDTLINQTKGLYAYE